MILVVYIGVKLALYALWCRYGIRLLTPLRSASAPRAFGLALARLAIGLSLGYGWALLLSRLAPSDEYSRLGFNPAAFVMGLCVMRWLAWSGVSLIIRMPPRGLSLLGVSRADRLWRLGGVGVSFVGDVFVLAGLVSVGGIVC